MAHLMNLAPPYPENLMIILSKSLCGAISRQLSDVSW